MGKELVFQALRHEKPDSIPWVPFAGVHAGAVKGYTAEEMLKDADKIVESLIEVNKLYMPDGLPILLTCRWRRRSSAANCCGQKTIRRRSRAILMKKASRSPVSANCRMKTAAVCR